MIVPSQAIKVLIATKPVDFRKGHDGLAAYAEKELGLKAHSGVVFRAQRADRIKILVWDESGLVLTYKRLDGGKFAWPAISDGVMRLSRAQFEALFEGLAPLSALCCANACRATGAVSIGEGCGHRLRRSESVTNLRRTGRRFGGIIWPCRRTGTISISASSRPSTARPSRRCSGGSTCWPRLTSARRR
ncbi:MAG: IS66 family insertion sequence element accessory protein TnpB [Paracoccaceae bacterium]